MINKISFTGREEMLVKMGQKAKSIEEEFVSEGKIYSKEEIKNVNQRMKKTYVSPNTKTAIHEYTSPYAPAPTGKSSNLTDAYKSEINPHDFDVLG